jgi:2-polyprenyl-3-methyl-5-hydroxy-6-metoxy-1,4-benzoquinol methylase
MPFLTQSRFPQIWKWFQYLIGGTIDKRKLCTLHFPGAGNVIEVGCSLGNIAWAFTQYAELTYTGIDIDPIAIKRARRDFRQHPNFSFVCEELQAFSLDNQNGFDYVLFAGILHHVNDEECLRLLKSAVSLMAQKAKLVVVEPILPTEEDNWFIHWFLNLEQGEYVRSHQSMLKILHSNVSLHLESAQEYLVGATPFSIPKCARFGVYKLSVNQYLSK